MLAARCAARPYDQRARECVLLLLLLLLLLTTNPTTTTTATARLRREHGQR
jgi:hypothetical protein